MSSHVFAKLGYVAPMIAYPVSATIWPEKRSNLVWDRREDRSMTATKSPGVLRWKSMVSRAYHI